MVLLCVFPPWFFPIFTNIFLFFPGDVPHTLDMYDTPDKQHQFLQWPDALLVDQQVTTGRFVGATAGDSFHQMRMPNFKSRTKTSHVTDNEKYHCLACNRKYLRKKSLTRHLRYECGKQPLYLCPVQLCSYKAFYRIVLEKHIQTHMKK